MTINEKVKEIIDDIVIEWCYRLPDGIPDLNDPKKLKALYEVITSLGYEKLLKEEKPANDSSVYVFYVDYFQPFTKGHYANYQKLLREFKNVAGDSFYFVTDDKTEKQKPFDFELKKKIMKFFGISDKKIIKVADLTDFSLYAGQVVKDPFQAAAIVAVDDINSFTFKNGQKKEYASSLKELDPISDKNIFYFYKMKNSLNSLTLVMGLLDSKNEKERKYYFSKYFGYVIPFPFLEKIVKQIKLQSKAEDIASKKAEEESNQQVQGQEGDMGMEAGAEQDMMTQPDMGMDMGAGQQMAGGAETAPQPPAEEQGAITPEEQEAATSQEQPQEEPQEEQPQQQGGKGKK